MSFLPASLHTPGVIVVAGGEQGHHEALSIGEPISLWKAEAQRPRIPLGIGPSRPFVAILVFCPGRVRVGCFTCGGIVWARLAQSGDCQSIRGV
jgi:hypothetical protein